jgi:hypothetical protein
MQSIALAVEHKECLFDNSSDRLGPQPARAGSLIEQFLTQGFRAKGLAHSYHRLFGQAVRKSEGHELDDISGIEMREMPA